MGMRFRLGMTAILVGLTSFSAMAAEEEYAYTGTRRVLQGASMEYHLTQESPTGVVIHVGFMQRTSGEGMDSYDYLSVESVIHNARLAYSAASGQITYQPQTGEPVVCANVFQRRFFRRLNIQSTGNCNYVVRPFLLESGEAGMRVLIRFPNRATVE